MSNENQMLFFCQTVNKMVVEQLLDFPIKELSNVNSISSSYYKTLIKSYTYFCPGLFISLSKKRASEIIEENKARMELTNSFKKLYEIYSFSFLLDLNEEIFKFYMANKNIRYTKYLGPFIKMIINYYYDERISALLRDGLAIRSKYNNEKIRIKKMQVEKKLFELFNVYDTMNFGVEKLAKKSKFEIYFFLSMFNLYLTGIKELKVNIEDEIWKIFKGIGSNDNTPKIIKKLREDKNIFEVPLQWINFYDLLEKDNNLNKIVFLFLYFNFKKSDLNYFLMDLNEKTKEEIAKIKTEFKSKENEIFLKEIENTSKDKKGKRKRKSKEKGIKIQESEQNNLKKANVLNEKEITNNTEEELNINILNANNNNNTNNNNTNNINISDNNNNLIIKINDNQEAFMIGLYDEISNLNKTIIDLKKKVTNLENKDITLTKDNNELKNMVKDLENKHISLTKDNNELKNMVKDQKLKLKDHQDKIKELTENNKCQLNILTQFRQKINNLENYKFSSAQKISNLEKLIFTSNLNTNFIGNRDYYKTTLAIILYNEELSIYNDKKEVKSPYEIVKELVKHYEEKMNKQNEYEIKKKMQVSEFLLLCIKCCEQIMHKLTISNLDFKENINILKLYSDNDFSNMIDSMIVFLQPQKLEELFKEKNRKIKNDYIKDEYNKVIKNVLQKDLQNNAETIYKHLFIKSYNYAEVFTHDFMPKFSLTPDILKIYFGKMNLDTYYYNCYINTDWKLMKNGIFDLDWKS